MLKISSIKIKDFMIPAEGIISSEGTISGNLKNRVTTLSIGDPVYWNENTGKSLGKVVSIKETAEHYKIKVATDANVNLIKIPKNYCAILLECNKKEG